MELYLDDQKTESCVTEEATLGEVLEDIKKRLGPTGRIVVGVACDGQDVTGDGYQDNLAKPSTSFDRIDFQSAGIKELVRQATETLDTVLDKSVTMIEEVVAGLAEGKISEALPVLAECCKLWGIMHEAVHNSVLMLQINPQEFLVDGMTLPQILVGPSDLLKQIKEVIEAKDFVLLSDILTYEFPDAIETWRKLVKELSNAAA